MEGDATKRYFIVVLTVLAIVLAFFLIKPYLLAVLAGAVFSMMLYPSYVWINKRFNNGTYSAVLIVVLVVLLFLLPAAYVIRSFGTESYYVYNVFRQKITTVDTLFPHCESGFICGLITPVTTYLGDPEVQYYLKEGLSKINKSILEYSANFIFTLPEIILQVTIFLMALFAFLRDAAKVQHYLRDCVPLSDEHQEYLFQRCKETLYGVIYGSIVVSLLQGLAGGIVFALFGFPSWIFWTVVMFLLSFIPVLPWVLFAPAGFTMIYNGIVTGQTFLTVQGILFLLLGLLIITAVDAFYKPYIIGSRTRMPNLVVVLGLVGGAQWFGLIGVLLGPVILSFLFSVLDIYHKLSHKRGKMSVQKGKLSVHRNASKT